MNFCGVTRVSLLVFALASLPLGAGDADIVKYRQSLMKSMAGYMNAMGAISKGTVPFRADLATHAGAVRDLARSLPSLFPAGTSPDKVNTDALPVTWTSVAKFRAAAKTLETEAARMQQLAKTDDRKAIAAQYEVMKKACGSCHDTFRIRDAS